MFGGRGRNKDIINPDFSWNPSQWFVERTSEMLYKNSLAQYVFTLNKFGFEFPF